MIGLKSSAPETVQERQYFSSTEGLPPVINASIGGAEIHKMRIKIV